MTDNAKLIAEARAYVATGTLRLAASRLMTALTDALEDATETVRVLKTEKAEADYTLEDDDTLGDPDGFGPIEIENKPGSLPILTEDPTWPKDTA